MKPPTFGPRHTQDGVEYRLWAPAATSVDVVLDRTYPMQRIADGWFTTEVKGVPAGARYHFHINNDMNVPDPASMFQPEDVFGPSQLQSHDHFEWKATDWKGRRWEETVIVETHVGTFTPEGTYKAMIDQLDHLAETGYTALELMPLAAFPGHRNWGYDGVLWYAPDATYGDPDDLKRLIDEAHRRGLMVFLDVVYNHLGPEGNFLGVYWPGFFRPDTETPWGAAINYGDALVQAFIIENAMTWLESYRFDGLRFDAIQAIIGNGGAAMLNALSQQVGQLSTRTGRFIHLMVENDNNTAELLAPQTATPDGRYRAQWNDDYHHAMHVVLTGEDHGYYEDFANAPLAHIARTLGSGFAYQGEPSVHRDSRLRGESSGHLPPTAFINFIQNHDQIGNRAHGERLTTLATPEAIEAALALTLLSPQIPMMFMGDEWGCTQPFPFFCDFAGDLVQAIREGRRREFAGHFIHADADIPDPFDDATFRSAILDRSQANIAPSIRRRQVVQQLLARRRNHLTPRLRGARFGEASIHDQGGVLATFQLCGATLRILTNLSDKPLLAYTPPTTATAIWNGDINAGVPPWSTHVWMENA